MNRPTTKSSQAELDDAERDDLAAVEEALADSDAEVSTVPHAEVSAWLKSLGTEEELPPPVTMNDE